jgi:hypothetical protein
VFEKYEKNRKAVEKQSTTRFMRPGFGKNKKFRMIDQES